VIDVIRQVLIREHGGPVVLRIEQTPSVAPQAGQVCISTRAIAVSKPDVLMRQGRYKWSPPLPLNPGNELTGVVTAVGEHVDSVRVGDAVLLSARELPQRGGCYTEQITAPASAVHVLPPNVDLEKAVLLPSYVVAHAMLNDFGLPRQARSAFINGVSGAVGSALAELAKLRGMTVIGTVGASSKESYAKSRGVDHVLNYNSDPLLTRVREITGGEGVDLVFDHVIGPRFADCIRMLGRFGTAVAYNVYSPMPDEDIFGLMRELSKLSLGLRVFNIHTYDRDLPRLHALTGELVQLLAQGRIDPVIGARFPLDRVADAHRLFESGEVTGKIVLIP
jgi:NADPH2:quinone reductase